MREKVWEYRNKGLKREDIEIFAKKCNIPPIMAVILQNRGITDENAVSEYFKKGLDGIHDPFLLNDMDKAAERIIAAADAGEKITVYGDYDADGVTSTAVLYSFLKEIGANVDYFLPDRNKDGYGLNIPAINRISRGGTKLMITVDCGITSVGEVEFAKTQGMDIIITDHHTCKETLPRAVAVINPKRADSTYPFRELAGVGVTFKLVLAVAVRMGIPSKTVFSKYVDFAAIGTVADVVPLLGENRVIADRGIAAVAAGKRAGIRALLTAAGASERPVDSTAVAFVISPRINAAGRMEHAEIAERLLLEENYDSALDAAYRLNETNAVRQKTERKIFEEAMEAASRFDGEQYVIVLAKEGWHSGVIGIAAARMCESFYRPCILLSLENGKAKGSGRSIEELNLFDAISDCEDLMTAFGGHAQAAGLSLSEQNIDEFRKRINEYAKKVLKDKILLPKIKIDCRLSAASINMKTAKMLKALEPFGCGNESPVFSLLNSEIVQTARMGSDGKHLRMQIANGGAVFNAVGFGMGDYCDIFEVGDNVDIVFEMSINVFRERETLQLILKDIKKA